MSEYDKMREAFNRSPHLYDYSGSNEAGMLYMYRSFRSFCSILENNCFHATNARFSNDEEEQKFAAEILQKPLEKHSIFIPSESYSENYVVCFCQENDKLSQWRGYAANGGVSIGFDFSGPVPFHAVPDDTKELGKSKPKEVTIFAQAERVVYLAPRDISMDEDEYYAECFETISVNPGTGTLDPEDIKALRNDIIQKAPYIKHKGFEEENEWRLVFPNGNGQFNEYLRYKKTELPVLQTPYIVVAPGDPELDKRACAIRVYMSDGKQAEDLLEKLRRELESIDVLIENCIPFNSSGKLDDRFCFGCTRRGWFDGWTVTRNCRYLHSESSDDYFLGVSNNVNNVIISQGRNQEKIFSLVHKYVQDTINCNAGTSGAKVKVWCEGHLPIRSITVGPGPNQSKILEYIKHYCRHTYWLRDVDVSQSLIPYRKSLI